MSIFVCDAIMGSGKSSAAINMMNTHPNEKYIYITPFLDETERIKKYCPKLHFVTPQDDLYEFRYSKHNHIKELISKGENITTTHQSYLNFDDVMLDMVKKQNYTLIMDESLDIYNDEFSLSEYETRALINDDIIENQNGKWIFKTKNITDELTKILPQNIKKLIAKGANDECIFHSSSNNVCGFYSNINKVSLNAFKDVYI